jgi:hypothetical protein
VCPSIETRNGTPAPGYDSGEDRKVVGSDGEHEGAGAGYYTLESKTGGNNEAPIIPHGGRARPRRDEDAGTDYC